MAEPNTNGGGGGGELPPQDGPISVPITITTNPSGQITAYTVVNTTLSVTDSTINDAIAVAYLENGNPIIVPNMPTPVWSGGNASFRVDINADLINALSSHQTTLVVKVTSGQHEGTASIVIAFP